MGDRALYLGRQIHLDERLALDADHLTTHAVCVGMTGSGKTGLGVVALEELARQGIPLLVIDLKGDMVNLLLNFPSLQPSEFEPWLPAAAGSGADREAAAEKVAGTWRRGLERSGLGPAEMREVRQGVRWQLVTPGAASAAPLDILPALDPPLGWDPAGDPDAATDRVNGVTSALLSLIGRGGDVLSDRDHVLTASVILEHWRRAQRLDLTGLLRSLLDPPFEALGALPLESFYPRDDRLRLVTALNALLASPAFTAWTEGVPLDMHELLGAPGEPRASVVSIAHLDERQRLFVIALLLSELVAWMRRQAASPGLRALLYIDEAQGIVPPHPANPPTKAPLLTLFKQGRAFGVGSWVATQNPVDLDYKTLGNAGVKLVGRLITDRDRERALEGLGMQRLPDGSDADDVVAGLGKREFLVVDVRAAERARTFGSRWAMSYLRGPVTLVEMAPLIADSSRGAETAARPVEERGAPSHQPPPLPAAATVRFAARDAGPAAPHILVRDRVAVRRAAIDLYREVEEVWWVPVDREGEVEWAAAEPLEEPPALAEEPPTAMTFPEAVPGRLSEELDGAESGFLSWRARRPVPVLVNERLKVAAAEGEGRDAFRDRCLQIADRADDATQERARSRYESRMRTLRKRLDRERGELDRDRAQLASREAEEKMSMVEGLFSVLLGSRGLSSASRKAASRLRSTATKRRMRRTAEGAVEESEREIVRIQDELSHLADEMEAEVRRIAAESEDAAEAIVEKPISVRKGDIAILDLLVVWAGRPADR